MEYRKYAIFLGIVLIVAGTIACGEKDTVSEKDRIKEEGDIIKSFLKAFRQNFKQSTIIWLLLIGTGCIVGYDWYIAVTYIKLNRQIINILE